MMLMVTTRMGMTRMGMGRKKHYRTTELLICGCVRRVRFGAAGCVHGMDWAATGLFPEADESHSLRN